MNKDNNEKVLVDAQHLRSLSTMLAEMTEKAEKLDRQLTEIQQALKDKPLHARE